MKEIKNIVSRYDQLLTISKKCALATVVHLEGSSYRRPGARMLIEDDGILTGAISGGCLEGDALRKALHVISENRSMLVTYDTMDDDDAKFGVGLGCNGIIQVLIEPIQKENPDNPIQLLKHTLLDRSEGVLITLFDLNDRKAIQYGTCFLSKGGKVVYNLLPQYQSILSTATLQVRQNAKSSFVEFPFSTAFIEYIAHPISLVVIGAGNDVLPLVQIANVLGWESHVVDGRKNYATADRFASACSLIVAKPEKVLEQLNIDRRTVFVLMTHNYNYDLAMLRALLEVNTPYIGSLGPKKKLDKMIQELKEEGRQITSDHLEKIFGPTGIHIGAETPEEIALSIITEIQTVLSDVKPYHLRDGNEFIHSREELEIIKPEVQ